MACDRTPYVYRIVSIYGEIYIGSRTAKKCDPREFWVTYFTSSKVVHSLIDKFGYDYFNIEHIEIFNTTEDAYRTEQKRIKDIWDQKNYLIDISKMMIKIFGSPQVYQRNEIRCSVGLGTNIHYMGKSEP